MDVDDVLTPNIELPKLEIGDWLYYPTAGVI